MGNDKFRIAAKCFFLTYSKCTATKQELQDLLHSKGEPLYSLIAQEDHADGTPHLHAVVKYSKTINVKSQAYFNLGQFHPSIEAVKKFNAAITYLNKSDKEPMEYLSPSGPNPNATPPPGVAENIYDLARSTGEEEFYHTCRLNRGNHPS